MSSLFLIFSAPEPSEPKAQLHYCDHALSVVRPSSVVVNFSHFRLIILWNNWTEFNETWQEARSQRPLRSLCFRADRKTKWPPGLWLAETFSTSPLKPQNGIQRNLTGLKIWTSSTKCMSFGPIGKLSLWLTETFLLLWNGSTEFNESLEEARSQRPLQSCVFQVDRQNKIAALANSWKSGTLYSGGSLGPLFMLRLEWSGAYCFCPICLCLVNFN